MSQEMRRKDREITGIDELLAIIDQCKVCRLGMSDNDQPYIFPLNFGYTFADNALTLYFHSAHEGKKIGILKKNSRACFEIDCDHALVEGETACSYGFTFSSIIGFGTVEFITNTEEKISGLNILMKHQTGKDTKFTFGEKELNAVCVCKMKVAEFTGKKKSAS